MTVRAITGPVTPDRIADLESTVLDLSVKLSEARSEVYDLHRAVQDAGRLGLQNAETIRTLIVQMGRLMDHITNHRDRPDTLCPICTPTETPGGQHEH